MIEQPVSQVDLAIDLSKILRTTEHEFSIQFQRDDYYGKKAGIMTIDGEIHQSMIAELEKKLGDATGTCTVISDRYRCEEYVNAIGVSQLILTWSCLEKLEHLLRDAGI
jgi:phosphoribulokinase